MYKLRQSNKFKKDFKLAEKRGLKISLFKEVITLLTNNGKLPAKYKTHVLIGKYKGLLECHIQPDWLLIWEQDEQIKLISLHRTGTHSDLF